MSTDNTPINEMPKSELRKSKTWLLYVDEDGICSACKEHTSPLDPCCSSPVYFEGGTLSFDSLWDQIEQEVMDQQPEPDLDAIAEDGEDFSDDHHDDEANGN